MWRVNQLLLGKLKLDSDQASGVSEESLLNALNELLQDATFPDRFDFKTIDLRAQALLFLERRTAGVIEPVERVALNRSILEAIYRMEMEAGLREEAYNPEDLRAIAQLSMTAQETLSVILATQEYERRTAEWAHDLLHPFKESGFMVLEKVLNGKFGPVTEEQRRVMEPLLQDAIFLKRHIGVLVHPEERPLKLDPTSVRFLIETVRDRFAFACSEKGIAWNVILPPSDLRVICDMEIIIHRVIANIIVNALRYTPEGGRLSLRTELRGKELIFIIQDNGPGIPQSNLKKDRKSHV
jgi:signal transduction histidine kinase